MTGMGSWYRRPASVAKLAANVHLRGSRLWCFLRARDVHGLFMRRQKLEVYGGELVWINTLRWARDGTPLLDYAFLPSRAPPRRRCRTIAGQRGERG